LAYLISFIVSSSLAAFSMVAGYNLIIFVLYLASYLIVLTYAPVSKAVHEQNIIHYTMSLLFPIASVLRAGMVSINLFSLLCSGEEFAPVSSYGDFARFGKPITYLIVWCLILFYVLVRGSTIRTLRWRTKCTVTPTSSASGTDKAVVTSSNTLPVLNVLKSFRANKAVDNVSFGVEKDNIFALLGPNGAGKLTCLTNLISSPRWRYTSRLRGCPHQQHIRPDPSSPCSFIPWRVSPVNSNRRVTHRSRTFIYLWST